MGLLDSLIGAATQGGSQTGLGGLLNKAGQQSGSNVQAQILQAVLGMLAGSGKQGTGAGIGGLAGLVGMLQQGGVGKQVESWISTGANLPVTGDQLKGALGNDLVANLARQFGLTPDAASGHLAQILPEVVNHVTPDGNVPQPDALADQLGGLLKMLGPR
ncbi:MAG: YidB family protein [Burkholderiales bacterium]